MGGLIGIALMLTRLTVAILIVGAAILPCSGWVEPYECTQRCLIELKGLRRVYTRGSATELSIHNQSKRDLDVNVAIEGLEDGWLC